MALLPSDHGRGADANVQGRVMRNHATLCQVVQEEDQRVIGGGTKQGFEAVQIRHSYSGGHVGHGFLHGGRKGGRSPPVGRAPMT